jgi:hypothetical protein
VRARTAALTPGRLGRARVGARDLGTGRGASGEASGSAGTDAGAWPAAAHGRARRRVRRALALTVLLGHCLINFFSKILNKT